MANLLGHCSLDRPATANAVTHSGGSQPDFLRPILNALRSALICDHERLTRITHLLIACDPLAVIRTITARVICSIEFVLWGGARPHIGDERGEVAPRFTDRYTACAVEFICRIVHVLAALPHSIPSLIFRRPSIAVRNIEPVSFREHAVMITQLSGIRTQ